MTAPIVRLSSTPHAGGHFELVVLAANPGGIACALRAAREGLRVLLVEASGHVGGMWSSGLQVFDTRYAGHRCPLLTEFTARLEAYYREKSGAGSPDHRMAQFGDPSRHGERPRFEPHVAELIFRDMLTACDRVRLLLGHQLVAVEKAGQSVRAILLCPGRTPGETLRVSGDLFVDATYEADLAAMAGAPFRVGREGTAEYDERHAGRRFTTIEPSGQPGRDLAQSLGLHLFNRTSRQVFPESTGAGDPAVQAYTVRLAITNVPGNRHEISRPTTYDRPRYLGLVDRGPDAHLKGYPLGSHYLRSDIAEFRLQANMPGGKADWIGGNLVGGNHGYPAATLAGRRQFYREHVDHALGMLYFLQHDPAVPVRVREHTREWGLARDEYADNRHVPYSMYVREARRLVGRYVFTEKDASLHPHHARSPIHADSVAFAEWPMDSHDCHPVRQPGSFNEGEFILADETRPSQIPYRCMTTNAVENLLVPVCLSATHVGWGTLRLETVFVHTGEAAGVAAAICLRDNVLPLHLKGDLLQEELMKRRIVVTYFADVELGRAHASTSHVQFLGARGFFAGYGANLEEPMGAGKAAAWEELLAASLVGVVDPNVLAARLTVLGSREAGELLPGSREDARALLRAHGWGEQRPLSVGAACQSFAEALRSVSAETSPA